MTQPDLFTDDRDAWLDHVHTGDVESLTLTLRNKPVIRYAQMCRCPACGTICDDNTLLTEHGIDAGRPDWDLTNATCEGTPEAAI